MTKRFLTEEDRAYCERSGRDVRQVEADLKMLSEPRVEVELVRPCTLGDGIRVVDAARDCRRYREARAAGRLSAFVPASGAAARMFQDILFLLDYPEPVPLDALEQLALMDIRFEKIKAVLQDFGRLAIGQRCLEQLDNGDWSVDLRVMARVILQDLRFDKYPKGLLPFHFYGKESRTAFAEHLVEASELIASDEGVCKVHFTVPNWATDRFAEEFGRSRDQIEGLSDLDWELELSIQDPATDTPALGKDQQPFRTADGQLLFRPGGHGSLLPNLGSMDGDVVVIKNIDNIVPDKHRELILRWRSALIEELLEVEEGCHRLIRALLSGEDVVRAARGFLLERFGVRCSSPTALFDHLNRPIRVCGMVPNHGEPGGGPFWVRSGEFSAPQIVEGAQIRPDQHDQLAESTHFNPVELVCSLRDYAGQAFDLATFADPTTSIITDRHHEGEPLRALERPGLWNGGMGRWNSVFVEVPVEIFTPVKRLSDLLRPLHQVV